MDEKPHGNSNPVRYKVGEKAPDGSQIAHIFGHTNTILVWEDSEGHVRHSVDANELSDSQVDALNRYSYLESRVRLVFKADEQKPLLMDLASALYEALAASSKEVQIEAFKGVASRIHGALLPVYLATAFVVCLVVCGVLWGYSTVTESQLRREGCYWLMIATCGALASVFHQSDSIGTGGHYDNVTIGFIGAKRILVGTLLAVFLILAIQGDLVLGAFKGNFLSVAAFAFVSGFSERFVLDHMSKLSESGVETKS